MNAILIKPNINPNIYLGNIISDGHNIKGNNILPNPPINISIIIEDVINIPWKVILAILTEINWYKTN